MTGQGGGRGRPAPVQLPLAVPPDSPAPPSELVYGMGRVDASGRVGDRDVMRALGRRPADMLTVTAARGVVLARLDPAGLVPVGGSPHLTIAIALRRRCGLEPGSQVLLVGHPDAQMLAACSLAVVDRLVICQMAARTSGA